jgi:hypothetical protein
VGKSLQKTLRAGAVDCYDEGGGFSSSWRVVGGSMDPGLSPYLSLAAVILSAAAFLFSLLAAYPGLKGVLVVIRDGVLWFSLFLVLGAGGFLAVQGNLPKPARTTSLEPRAQLAADSLPQRPK